MTVFTSHEEALARALMRIGAIKFGAFRLKLHESQPDARLSPIYVNLRTPDSPKAGPLGDHELGLIALCWREIMWNHSMGADLLCAIPNAGTPMGAHMQARTGLETVQLIKQEIDGTRQISSMHPSPYVGMDKRTLLLDAVISGAHTKLEAVAVLRASGFDVRELMVVLDRMQGGDELMHEFNVEVFPIFKIDILLGFYVEEGDITQMQRDEVLAYLQSQRIAS